MRASELTDLVASLVLPHAGQGASQALEDGEALAVCLRDVKRADVPAALRRAFNVRYKRASEIQRNSRAAGLGEMRTKHLNGQKQAALNPLQFRDFQWKYFGAERWEKEMPDWIVSTQ